MDLTAEEIREVNARLDREWDVDRWLHAIAGGGALFGLLLGAVHSPRWRFLSVLLAAGLLSEALCGWCPSKALLLRLGVRTRAEIERERYTTLFGQEPPVYH